MTDSLNSSRVTLFSLSPKSQNIRENKKLRIKLQKKLFLLGNLLAEPRDEFGG
jgi:hypothetical protein